MPYASSDVNRPIPFRSRRFRAAKGVSVARPGGRRTNRFRATNPSSRTFIPDPARRLRRPPRSRAGAGPIPFAAPSDGG